MKNILYKFILAILMVIAVQVSSIPQQLKTTHISIAEGLSNVNVTSIIQDKYGFLWVGTEDGLNRFDGYEFKVFKSVPGNPNSLINNNIRKIAEDSQGNLWIATQDGLSFYSRKESKFVNYDLDTLTLNRPEGFPQTLSVYVDSDDDVWVGSIGSGLIKFNESENRFENIPVESERILQSELDIVSPIIGHKGKIYAADYRYGLIYLDKDENILREIKLKSDLKIPEFGDYQERITNLLLDPNEVLWVTTEFGQYKLDIASNEIWKIQEFKTKDLFNIWRLHSGLIMDQEGNVWLGKDARGLYKYDGISDEFSQIDFGTEYGNKPNIYDRLIRSLYKDNTGIIWIGTFESGLFKFDPAAEPFAHYSYDAQNPTSISGNEIFGILQSKINPDLIYVGTRGSGLNLYYPLKSEFKKLEINFENDMFGGSVRCILEEEDGKLYLGTWGDGLYEYTKGSGAKLVSKWDSSDNSTLSNNLVRILEKDPEGFIWVGTNYGLNIFDPVYKRIKRIYSKESVRYPQELIDLVRKKERQDDRLISILEVGDNQELRKGFTIEKPRDYLVVSVGEGRVSDSLMVDFGRLEDESGKILWDGRMVDDGYYLNGAEKNRIRIDVIRLKPGKYNLYYKSDFSHSYVKWNADAPIDSSLWGIQIMNLDSGESISASKLLEESRNQPLISGNNIRSIHVSNAMNNIVWIGTDANGLDKFDRQSEKIINYRNDPQNHNTLSNNSVQYIHEDNNGILWLATNGGLNRFDPKSETFTVYTEGDGLPTNYVASILGDDAGNLWLATRNGLSRMSYSGDRATFVNYDSKDGLGGSDFIAQVALKSTNGKLYFGGEHGLNEFTPGRMNINPPDLIITDLKISNRSVTVMGEDSPIKNSIFETKNITLTHDQNDLSFEFAALHYARAEKNQYAHILEGYDNDWSYDNRKFATYTNLDPGEYVFKFRGSNSDGVWNNEGRSIAIRILPPWWFTTWAYIGYGLFFVGIIFAVDRIQRRRLLAKVRERRKIEEAELRAEKAELQAKASQAEKRVLEAEFNQKKRELEEARELQLSMLPKELPNLPNLDIAVYMKTATEVGGDYYDFHVGLDGTLTVVLGDATGHGMKAGTMVTTAKTLFYSYADNPDILLTFQEMSRCIKQMRFQMLSMCMTMLKVQGNKLLMSAAGMPPLFIYRKDDKTIEEHVIKGMPLGTIETFPYEIKKSSLRSGDTILLMSDGLPELINDRKEIFGYKRARNKFEEIAELDSASIIDILKEEGSKWIDGNDPGDDVTFVVLKVK